MIMRILGLSFLLLLGGCMHYAQLTPSDFSRGNVSPAKFARDNYECRTKAVIRENINQGGGDQIGSYNRAYATCMKRMGYGGDNIELAGFDG
jgi:hypothetical protein